MSDDERAFYRMQSAEGFIRAAIESLEGIDDRTRRGLARPVLMKLVEAKDHLDYLLSKPR